MNTSPEEPRTTSAMNPNNPSDNAQVMNKRLVQSDEIMAGEKEIWIQHGDSVYRLCETKSGKLILQK